jgi:hypothetical protein
MIVPNQENPMPNLIPSLICCVLLLSFSTRSQENVLPSPQAMPLDFVSEQLSVQLLNNIRAKSTPQLVQAQAQYFRLLYLALLDAGFDAEQALKIVVAMATETGPVTP